MRVLVTIALACSVAACGATTGTGAGGAPESARGPSPGPRAEDGFDDAALRANEADLQGRTGDDAARAELRLLAAQTRAFAVSVVRASRMTPAQTGASVPAEAADAGGTGGGAVFSPPATLVTQLGVGDACATGADPLRCAGQLGEALINRLTAARPPAELLPVRDGLLAALAVLGGETVPVERAVRWRVLSEADDVGAHLAQVLTLADVARQVDALERTNADSEFSARTGARLVHRYAIGPCSEAYGALADESPEGGHETLGELSVQGCVPECATTALGATEQPGTAADAVRAGALACASEAHPVVWGPFREAARTLGHWAQQARARLEAAAGDTAVGAILPAAAAPAGELPMPPPLFVAGGGVALDLPPAPVLGGDRLSIAGASAIVWLPESGPAWVMPAPRFTLAEPPNTEPVRADESALRGALGNVISSLEPPERRALPPGLVIAHGASAARILAGLAALRAEGPAAPTVVGVAMRNGPFSRYVAAAVTDADAPVVFRVGEGRVTVIEHGSVARVAEISANTGMELNGAVPSGAPTEPFSLALEPDATGLAAVRVIDALAIYGARATPAVVPLFSARMASGAMIAGVADAARAAALRAAVDAHQPEAMRCLQNPPAGEPLPLRADLHLTLDARGRPGGIEVQTNTHAAWESVTTCLTRAATSWRLPPGNANAQVRAAYVLESIPEGGAASPAASPAPAHGATRAPHGAGPSHAPAHGGGAPRH